MIVIAITHGNNDHDEGNSDEESGDGGHVTKSS